MAAVQLTTAASTLVAADPDQHREVTVANLGPNKIYLETNGTATVIGGLPVAATTGAVTVKLPAGVALSAIVETANQASPADTRILIR